MDATSSTTMTGTTPTRRTAVWPRGVPTVGQAAERSRTIGPDDIDTFAAISGDRNPLHYDAEFAASTKLGGIVVQSGLITAIINGAAAQGVPGPGSVFLNTNLDFKAPVRPGDTITGRVGDQAYETRPSTDSTWRGGHGTGYDGAWAAHRARDSGGSKEFAK